MSKRITRILAGLLCLLLVIGFVPADILGGLIPEAAAAAINFKTWTKDNFNGLFIIRSESDPSLVLTLPENGYFNTQFTYQKLGSVGDIRRQMFVFRSSRNSITTNITTNTTVYFRCLYDVYRYSESGNTSFGNLWVQSGRSDFPASYPLVPQEQGLNSGVPEDATNTSFAWKLNIYASDTTGDYAGFMKVGICENNTDGDNNAAWRYIIRDNNNKAVFSYNSGIYNFAHYLQPVSYGVPDARNVNLHTSTSETSQYLQADYSFAANSSVVNYNSSNADWPTAWSLSRLPNGYHAIVSTQHGRYLAISDAGNPTLGNKAVLTDGAWSSPQDAEQWQFVPYYYHGQGFTYLIVNKASGRLLMRSASSNTHICNSYYTVNEQCNRWMITYINNSKYQNTVSNAGYTLQTGYSPLAYSDSTIGINYPLNLTTGSGAAYSTYNTLKLNPASTVTGHFFDTDKAVNNATAESRFDSTRGYVFDTRFLTDSAYNLWEQAISYSGGVIQNTLNAFQSNLLSTGNPPHPFKPVGSSNYTATIQFQFKYTSGMFMKYYGGKYSFNVKIQSTDLNTVYFDNWTADTDMNVDFSKLTAGTTYVMTISKASNSDAHSHFSIFTNVTPATTVDNPLDDEGRTKLYDVATSAYMGGSSLALNAVVPVNSLLEYRVKVTNRSIYNLIPLNFQSMNLGNPNDVYGDRNLGTFSFGSNMGFQPSDAVDAKGESLTLNELSFVVYNAEGTAVATINNISNSTGVGNMMLALPDGANGTNYGLPTGWSIEVRGIYYKTNDRDHGYGRKLVNFAVDAKLHIPGVDTLFQKISANTAVHFTNEPFFIQWADQEMTIDKALLMQTITAAGKHKYEISLGLSKDTITSVDLCDYNGSAWISEFVSTSGTTLKLNYKQPGVNQIILKVYYNDTFAMIPTQVFVYDVSDKTYVLDYGLPVVLEKDSYTDSSDLNQDMTIKELGGTFEVTVSILQITGTKPGHNGTSLTVEDDLTTAYATISYNSTNGTITYTPTAILNGPDYIYVVFKLVRNTKLGVAVADELLMYKTITILPGNVVYYEDTIGSIKYPNGFTLDELGTLVETGVSGKQDALTSDMLGHDDGSYANAKDVMISGESVHKVHVTDQEVTVSFTFTGTGFELISRVNAKDAATILVMVRPKGGTDDDWTYYPVITRFDPLGNGNAEVYQVPVFRLNNGAHGTYEVQVVGLPMQDYGENGAPIPGTCKPSFIYVDGIRVYNPLGNSDLTTHYGAEQGAEFTNLRDLILEGKGVVALYTDAVTGFTTGDFYYIGAGDRYDATLGGINELGAIGANNEILIHKDTGNHIVVLKVKETVTGNGLLQIGIHDIHDGKFDGTGDANDPSTVSYNTTSGWVTLKKDFYSGTEQYYSIDLNKCPTNGGYRIVVLRVDSGFVSFTNVKHKNVEFGGIGEKALAIYTEPGYYFNQNGDMCHIDESGKEFIDLRAADTLNLNMINDMMSQGDDETETV